MQPSLTLIAVLPVILVGFSCKKNDNINTRCFANTTTVRQITNAKATVKKAGNKFFIIEHGTIDTRLNPCELSPEFQADDLQVTISGDVKLTSYETGEPCCTDDFVIRNISK